LLIEETYLRFITRSKFCCVFFFSDSAVFFIRGPHRIGGQYKKARYFEYTDDTFTSKKPHPSHLGFLGPVIRAEVGDTIKVAFKNLVSTSSTT
jgi:hypothetical protein